MRTPRLALALALAAALPLARRSRAAAPAAQRTPDQQLTESQRRLQEIRAERSELRRDLSGIRSRVHDVSAEIRNIQRQREVSASLLRELNLQMTETQRKIDETTDELLRTQDELAQKRALLDRRLRDIYKRGPLQAEEVLLTAHSFADLLNRYKYLYLVALRDRRLVGEVAELQHQLELREQELRRSYTDLPVPAERARRGARAAAATWRSSAAARCPRCARTSAARWSGSTSCCATSGASPA